MLNYFIAIALVDHLDLFQLLNEDEDDLMGLATMFLLQFCYQCVCSSRDYISSKIKIIIICSDFIWELTNGRLFLMFSLIWHRINVERC